MGLDKPFIAIGQFHEFKLMTGERLSGIILSVKKDSYLVAQKTIDAGYYPQILIFKNQIVWVKRHTEEDFKNGRQRFANICRKNVKGN